MLYLRTLILGVAVATGIGAAAPAQETSAETVLATVNGKDITVGHVIALASTLSDQEKQLPSQVLLDGLLERLIQQTAVATSGVEVAPGTRLRIENETSGLIAGDIVSAMARNIEVTDEQIQTTYDAQYASATPMTEYNASHILVATQEEAAAIAAEARGGADFAGLAREKSTGPSGPNGGNLGWFGAGRMVAEFEAAVIAMEKGAISDPVQTQFGWHVIRLNDTRALAVPTLEETREDLRNTVWREELSAGIDMMVEKAEIARADISGIDPEVVRDLSLIGY